MIKNSILDSLRANTAAEVKDFIDHSFATAARIDFILQKQGKSRRDLAVALGKNESEISKWMTGTHNFTSRTISKIQTVLGEKIWQIADDFPTQYIFHSRIGKSDYTVAVMGRRLDLDKRQENFEPVKDQFDSSEICHLFN